MSKIATYSLADSPLQLSDRLIGTEAPRPTPSATPLATKNFSLGELLQLFSTNFPAYPLQDVLDENNTATQDINLTGTINVTLIKPTNIEDMLGSQGTPLQILSKGVGGICWIDIPNVSGFVPTSRELTINGVTYDLSANRSWTVSGATWGSITGTISSQTDLINFLDGNFYPLSSNPAGYITQDNVVEYPDLASFPPTGVIGTVYIALDTGFFYSWNGTMYVLSSPPDTGITGVGTTNTYPKFTSPTTIGNGRLVDGINGGVYTLGSQWINLINGGSVLRLNRSQSFMEFTLGVQNFFATTIYSSQAQEGLTFDSQGNFAIGSGGPSGSPTQRFFIDRITGNIHIGGAANVAASDKLQVTGDLRVTGAIKDSNNSSGTAGQLLSSTATGTDWIDPPSSGGGIPHATASGIDTYTATITGVTAYNDADAYLIRFTNGNTTSATLNINGLGAKALYRNNDGVLIGGDIISGGEMLCVYNSTINRFQVIGTSPNSLLSYVTNDDSVTLTKGMPVYAFGGTGDRMTVKRAFNTSDTTSAQTVGLVLSTSIAPNQKGLIMMQGLLDGLSILPTGTWSDGDAVYLGATAGTITNVKPFAPNHLVYLGTVTTASNGSAGRMYVRVQNGYELQELHNVQAQSPALKDTLWYDNAVSPPQWKTASIETILGAASVSNNGYLTSTDWTTFNNKPNAQNVDNFIFSRSNVNIGTATGTTAETIIFQTTFAANTFVVSDIMTLTVLTEKTTALGGYTVGIRLGTTGTTADQLIARNGGSTSAGFLYTLRTHMQWFSSNILRTVRVNVNEANDTGNQLTNNLTVNPTVSLIFSVSITLANAGDSVALTNLKIGRIKSF